MKIEQDERGYTRIETGAPSIVLVFETESSGPVCSWPRDQAQLHRILDGLDDEWRDLLIRAVES